MFFLNIYQQICQIWQMANGQDFGKKAVNEFIGAGVGREDFSLPHLKGSQGHPSLLRQPRPNKKTPRAPSTKALAPGPLASEPSASLPPSPGPPAPGRASSSLPDL